MNIIMCMETGFDILVYLLNLSENQARALRVNRDKYDLSRLAVRDGALYAPIKPRGIYANIRKIIFGPRTDVIDR